MRTTRAWKPAAHHAGVRRLFSLLIALSLAGTACGQTWDPKLTEVWEPEPAVVTPGTLDHLPPSDALILFDGTSTDAWENGSWSIDDGVLTVGKGSIQTKQSFGDVQLHVEWRTPTPATSDGQGRGNSGVFLQGRYEVQVLDSYENRTYSNGQAGSVYKQYAPLVNASRPPGEWQSYNIIYAAPIFREDGRLAKPGFLTVLHNGVLVQNHVELRGNTEYIGLPEYEAHGPGPIMLQDHGNPVQYRNIWVREL